MRIAHAAILALALATPAMAQDVTIQGPDPGAARADSLSSHRARIHQHVSTRHAQIDHTIARRDAAHGNYVGAARAQQDARMNMQAAHRAGSVANQDAARAANQDSTHITVSP